MSKPYTEIKEAIESVGRYTEEKRTLVNWDEAVYPELYGRTVASVDPATSSQDRDTPTGKPKAKSEVK